MPTHIPDDAWDWMDPDRQDNDDDDENPNDEYCPEDERERGGENEGD